jgi:hypothetical protein
VLFKNYYVPKDTSESRSFKALIAGFVLRGFKPNSTRVMLFLLITPANKIQHQQWKGMSGENGG